MQFTTLTVPLSRKVHLSLRSRPGCVIGFIVFADLAPDLLRRFRPQCIQREGDGIERGQGDRSVIRKGRGQKSLALAELERFQCAGLGIDEPQMTDTLAGVELALTAQIDAPGRR